MSDAIKIPFVGHGDTHYITQEEAEECIKTAEYWHEEYYREKSRFDMLNSWQKSELKQLLAVKKTDNRIIMLLSVVCIIETLFLIGVL